LDQQFNRCCLRRKHASTSNDYAADSWTNAGFYQSTNSTVNLGGSFTKTGCSIPVRLFQFATPQHGQTSPGSSTAISRSERHHRFLDLMGGEISGEVSGGTFSARAASILFATHRAALWTT